MLLLMGELAISAEKLLLLFITDKKGEEATSQWILPTVAGIAGACRSGPLTRQEPVTSEQYRVRRVGMFA